MDTKKLIAESKARFNHNSARAYLAEKYNSKLIIASQGGLWKADPQTLTLLSAYDKEEMILLDTFGNPVKVKRMQLLQLLGSTHEAVMEEWYKEWMNLESKR